MDTSMDSGYESDYKKALAIARRLVDAGTGGALAVRDHDGISCVLCGHHQGGSLLAPVNHDPECPYRLALELAGSPSLVPAPTVDPWEELIDVRVRRIDAQALVLGGLDYAMAIVGGRLPSGGSPMRLRVALRDALEASPSINKEGNDG